MALCILIHAKAVITILRWLSTVKPHVLPRSHVTISALEMFAESRYADIKKKCRYGDIADADINIGKSLVFTLLGLTIKYIALTRYGK